MALLASVYGFRHSRWNKLAEKESVILQCCECIHDVRPEQVCIVSMLCGLSAVHAELLYSLQYCVL